MSQGKKNLSPEIDPSQPETCGERLLKLLDIIGITKTQLATESGVTVTTISKYCESDSIPGSKVLLVLVQKYRVRAEWLMGAGGQIFSTNACQPAIHEPPSTDYEQACLRLQHELAAKDREAATKDRELASIELAMSRQQGKIYEAVMLICRMQGLTSEQTRALQRAVMHYETVLSEEDNNDQSRQAAAGNS